MGFYSALSIPAILTNIGLAGYFYLTFDLLIPTRAYAIKSLISAFKAFTLPVILYIGLLWVLYPIA